MSLTTKVMILSLVPITLLGLGLARTMHHRLATRSLTDATKSAKLLARIGVWPRLSPSDLRDGISPAHKRALDDLVRGAGRTDIARIKIWNQRHQVVYSDDPSLIGKHLEPSDDLRVALAGNTASDISDATKEENIAERHMGQLLEVYLPLRFHQGNPPDGAFELYVPFDPVAAGIASDTRMIVYMLLIGLIALWTALFRIVSRASRRLRCQAEENRHQALHDGLTGLPNRAHFHERVQAQIDDERTDPLSIVLLDLDRFKEINDTLGHAVGDRLLCQIGDRIATAVRPEDMVARLGGDEFALLLPGIANRERALSLARRVIESLESAFEIDGMTLDVSASAGVAIYPLDGLDAEALMQRADVAMYLAKESREGVELYDPRRDEHSTAQLALLGELRRSLEAGELTVHYQPKATIRDGSVAAMEALVRWNHPRRGMIAPDDFVPLAEQSGLIGALTDFVLERALADTAAFHEQGLDVGVAVNVSVRNLLDPQLPDTIERLFDTYPTTRGHLELEITESAIVSDTRRACAVLRRLAEMGVTLAIDDFGTGYSSLAQLKTLGVDTIKIDKSFVMGIDTDHSDDAIVEATVHLGRSLGVNVVAEGVESELAWNRLRELGCTLAQGYFVGRPMGAMQVPAWHREWVRQLGTAAAAA